MLCFCFHCRYMPTCASATECLGADDQAVVNALVTKAISVPLDMRRAPLCDTPLDLVLVLDGSGSISSKDFAVVRRIIPAIAQRFDLRTTRISVVQFGTNAVLEQTLSANASLLWEVADGMRQLGGETNTAEGLNRAQTELVLNGRNVSAAKHTIVLVSDGAANRGTDPLITAAAIKKSGVDIYSVGVGSDINATQLQGIASAPTELHYFESWVSGVRNQIDLSHSRENADPARGVQFAAAYGRVGLVSLHREHTLRSQ